LSFSFFISFIFVLFAAHRIAQLSFNSFTSVSAKAQKMKTVTAQSGSGDVLWNAQVYDCTTKRGSSLKQH
jgi:basic membrane lipoprotein Med (substrate-binding protein (PBP1-ABC) superfamily)